jgi:hypothetical protein
MKHPPIIPAMRLYPSTKSKREYIEFVVPRVVGRAKLAALPRFEFYAVKERGLMKCSVIAAIRENCTQEA